MCRAAGSHSGASRPAPRNRVIGNRFISSGWSTQSGCGAEANARILCFDLPTANIILAAVVLTPLVGELHKSSPLDERIAMLVSHAYFTTEPYETALPYGAD